LPKPGFFVKQNHFFKYSDYFTLTLTGCLHPLSDILSAGNTCGGIMIRVENLTRYYNDICAVDHIRFDMNKGEILGLLGPNGAGKTTTLRMMTGFLKPTSGNIFVKDFSIDKNPLEIKQLMGYLPESAPLYHDMLVYDYLAFVADIRKMDKARRLSHIRRMADLCALNDVMHQPIAELSKGYKQRVGLAHAMINDPEILILDEPTSGLDPNQIIEIRDIIRRIGKEKTIILSTHILSEAEATCDRIIIIHQGKIAADDSTENLKHAAGSASIIHLTLQGACFEDVSRLFSTVPGLKQTEKIDEKDGLLTVRTVCSTTQDLRGPIYLKIKETDWTLLEFQRKDRSLENIFRELTKEN
jgi:ABC-2 type transport system ATP-binding protein